MAEHTHYIELMSQALDGQLSPQEQASLNEHLAHCSDCEILFRQLTELHSEWNNWEEQEVPAGFTEGVLSKVRAYEETKPKLVPIWKHRQFKALGSLATCAVLCLGLWRVTAPQEASGDMAAEAVPMAVQANELMTMKTVPSSSDLQQEAAATPALYAADADLSPAEEIAQLCGAQPGQVLVLPALELEAEGLWYTLSDGRAVLVVKEEASQSLFQQLLPDAVQVWELGEGPLAIVIE